LVFEKGKGKRQEGNSQEKEGEENRDRRGGRRKEMGSVTLNISSSHPWPECWKITEAFWR